MITERQLRDEFVAAAREDLGWRETHGKNRSPQIDAVIKACGASLGDPYCAAGLSVRVIKRVCDRHGLKNPFGVTASSQKFYSKTPEKYHRSKAQKADFGVLRNRMSSSTGHVYLVTADQGSSKSHSTIEYNTNKAGSREGDGVFELERSTSGTLTKKFRGFVDIVQWICDVNGIGAQ